MSPETPTQERLTRALQRRADDVRVPDFAPERVRAGARRIRRARRARVAVVAAAAVAAVVVPTTVLLQNGDPTAVRPVQPAHSGPSSPSPTAQHSAGSKKTHTPHRTRGSAPALDDLAAIPRGAGTFLSYTGADGVVHDSGATSRLPGRMSPSTQFLHYRDGWLVAGADNQLRRYDSSGKVVASGRFGGITVTDDRTQAAWVMGGKLYQSGLSTMSEAQDPKGVSVPASAALIGYLPQGPALLGGDHSIRIATGSGSLRTVSVGLFPTTTSQSSGLVGGSIGTPAEGIVEGAVYDLRTRTRLWHNGWMPLRFSDDGTLVAASPAGENGDPSAIAILDARTGRVVARTPSLQGLYPSPEVAWDDHRLIIPTGGADGTRAALLALHTSGRLTRVSAVERSTRAGHAYLIVSAQP